MLFLPNDPNVGISFTSRSKSLNDAQNCPENYISSGQCYLIVYVQCLQSVLVQEIACPLCIKVESKGLEVNIGRVAHLTFMSGTEAYVMSKIYN